MATNRSDYVVEINGDPSGLDRATQAASKRISAFGANTKKAFAGFGDQIFSLRGAIGSIAAGFSFKAIIDATVAAERASAQLDATLRSTRGAAGLNREELLRMAAALSQVTTVEDDAVVGAQSLLLTFTRIGREVFPQALEAILDVSTAMGTDLKSAALQVGKALNDPVKGAAALAEAGIQFTQVQKDQIKALVESGRVVEAQRIVLAELETQFGGSARAARDTFGGALAALKNTAGDLLEGEGGNLKDVTASVNSLTDVLSSESTKGAFRAFTGLVLDAAAGLSSLAVNVINLFRDLSPAEKISNEIRLIDEALTASSFLGKPVQFLGKTREELEALRAELSTQASELRAASDPASALTREITQLGLAYAELQKVINSGSISNPQQLAQAQAQADQLIGRIQALRAQQSGGAPSSAAPAGPVPVSSAEANKAAQAARQRAQAVASAEAAVFKAQLGRSRASLEALNAQNLLSLRDYHAQKLQLELDAIDRELEARRTAQATATDAERVRIAGEIEALGIQRVAAIEASGRELVAAEKQLGEERLALEERLLEATGRGAEAQAAAIEREFAELIARLRAQGDEAGVAIAIELKGVELARAQFETLEAELSTSQERYQRRLQEIDVAVATGARTRSQSRRDQVAAAQALVAEEERIADAMAEQAAVIGDPELLGRVAALRQEILITGTVVDDTFNQVRGAFEDGLGGALVSLQKDITDVKGAVEDMLQSIVASIQRIIAQRLAEDFADSLFGGLLSGGGSGGSGSGGGLFSGIGDFFSGLFAGGGFGVDHNGGMVGQETMRKRVPAITFANAERFHRGGMVGLKPDEVPIIAQTGERVLNREQTRSYNAGQAGAAGAVVNVNISTPDARSFRVNRGAVETSLGSAVSRAMKRNT